jgi:hypothetical protein
VTLGRRGAEALAPITTLLTNLAPDRMTFSVTEGYLEDVVAMYGRWQEHMRDPLIAFGLAHPSPDVHAKTVELDTHVEWVLIRGAALIRDVLADSDYRPRLASLQRRAAAYRRAPRRNRLRDNLGLETSHCPTTIKSSASPLARATGRDRAPGGFGSRDERVTSTFRAGGSPTPSR